MASFFQDGSSIEESQSILPSSSNNSRRTYSSIENDSPEATPQTPPSSEGTPWYIAVFLVVNAALGSAFLNFPEAFDEAGGVGAALGVQSVLLLIASATLIILAYCSDASQAATYQDVILGTLGPRFGTICSLVIVVYCFGTCITFLIIIGDQWDRFFFSYTDDPLFCHAWYMNRRFTIASSSFAFILPLCYPKRIDFLKYASAAGVVANIYIDFLQVYKFYTGEYKSQAGPIKTAPTHWTDLFLVAPTIFFGYQCHVSAVPIYSCLKNRSVAEFLKTVLSAMAVCALTYSVSATYGYWTFGSNVESDILTNYDADDPMVLAALIAMAFKTYTTYPLIIFCGRTGVDSLWLKMRVMSPEQEEVGEKKRRILQVSIWFSLTLVIGMFIPGIEFVIPILGAFAAAFIVIFPGLCLLELAVNKIDKTEGNEDDPKQIQESGEVSFAIPSLNGRDILKLVLALFLIIFGAFMLGIIVTNSFMTLDAKKPLCSV